MKVILTALGSSGDVFPVMGLGLRLQQRGHAVVVIASGHFAPLAARLGLGFVGLGTDEDYRRAIQHPDLFHPTRGFQTIAQYVRVSIPPLYDALLDAVEPGNTVVGAHVLDFASRLAQERHGLPVATLVYAPALFRSLHQLPTLFGVANLSTWPHWAKRVAWWLVDRLMIDPAVVPTLTRLRAERGLAPVRRPFDGWLFSPTLTIGLFPSWFAPPQPDWPPQLRLTSFPLFDAAEPVPPELEAFLDAGDPPVLVTLGTGFAHGRDRFRDAVAACQRLGRRAVLLTRFSELPEAVPTTVLHVPFAPLSQIAPRCAALVHHGGIGTTAAGLASGVPQVVMPMSHDQPDNAARVRRLGVAETLLPRDFRADRLAASLNRLLSSPAVAGRCAVLAERLRQTDGIGEASDLLEALGRDAATQTHHRSPIAPWSTPQGAVSPPFQA